MSCDTSETHPDKSALLTPEEQNWIIHRRREAGAEQDQPVIGLALSGGGIRSATFCLGLIRALAKNGVLNKVDFLSTVSGGGYTGGMLGRLYHNKTTPQAVEDALAKESTLLLWWLRNCGRYLAPAGMSDVTQSLAQIIRSFLFTFTLITLLSTLICSLAIGLRSLFGPWLDGFGYALAIPLAFAGWQCCAYWIFSSKRRYFAASILFSLVFLFLALVKAPVPWGLTLLLTALCLVPTLFDATSLENRPPALRLFMTRTLTVCLLAFSGLLFIALVNRLGYWIYYALDRDINDIYVAIPATLALLKLLGQLRPLQRLGNKLAARGKKKPTRPLMVVNIAGFVLVFLVLIVGCAGLIDFTNRWASFWSTIPAPYLLIVEVIPALVILIFWRDLTRVLNLSSLHNLYRARIERAWLSVANFATNHHENPRFPCDPAQDYTRDAARDTQKVTTVLPKDDICFSHYNPAQHGGPLHLITCCINQTVDDRTGNYNADRKGIALTVSTLGVETGTGLPQAPVSNHKATLSRWLAISGGAASTGMGSQTSPGLAFMLFLFGGRLGYWARNLITPPREIDQRNSASNASPLWRWCNVVFAPGGYLFAEMFARFPGLGSAKWFLSDGGHFENTAVYALLKRRLPIIILADCGADPGYVFDDIENLVRKARIDFQTTITFYDYAPFDAVGAKAQVRANAVSAPLLMARIGYPDRAPGVLIIVKPHWLEDMPLDSACYAQRNPVFPQQSTGDQFFDEAQWEAYHQLGWQAGQDIDEQMLLDAREYALGDDAP